MAKSKIIYTSDTVTTIDLLRHGQTGSDDVFRGYIDVDLSEAGWHQMADAVGDFNEWRFLVSSPLKRCLLFAKNIGKQNTLAVHIEPHLKEIGFGTWEGQKPQAVWEQNPDAMKSFWLDPENNPPPEGERLSHFYARVVEGLHNTLTQFKGQHGLIVCHGGVVRMMIAHVLSIPLKEAMRIQVPFASVSRLQFYHHEHEPDTMSLVFHNGVFK
jgi:alpha-ribazole phosphatase